MTDKIISSDEETETGNKDNYNLSILKQKKKPVHNNNEKEEHVEIEKFTAEKEANFSLSIRIRPERKE